MRQDDPQGMREHEGRFEGGVGLVVLGGSSGHGWMGLRDEVRPDVIITANGMTRLPGADYWVLGENMNYCHSRGMEGDERLMRFMAVLDRENTAEFKLINHRNWNLLSIYGIDEDECISIRRMPYELENFTMREYGHGFINGELSESAGWERGVTVRKGTVGLQLLHLAGILGCAEVHTIGFDLMFRDMQKHHWYEHPAYEAARFRNEGMFVNYRGVDTQDWWVESAQYLKGLEAVMERDGLVWRDHSEGLLAVEEVWCTQ